MDNLEKLKKLPKNEPKTLCKFLKYTGKLKTALDYEDYLKDNIKVPLMLWALDILIIQAFLIFVVLECFSVKNLLTYTTPMNIFLAEGISISLYLLVELKREFWRKQ